MIKSSELHEFFSQKNMARAVDPEFEPSDSLITNKIVLEHAYNLKKPNATAAQVNEWYDYNVQHEWHHDPELFDTISNMLSDIGVLNPTLTQFAAAYDDIAEYAENVAQETFDNN
jgi:hypothetical protein